LPSLTSSLNNFSIGNTHFDYLHQTISLQGNSQKLTTKEAELLKLLCINSNQVLDRNIALKAIWKDDSYFNGRSMDVYITKLRKYLKEDEKIELINVHGKGFKLLVKET
jgi:DNA-binding response OmpR family regulator